MNNKKINNYCYFIILLLTIMFTFFISGCSENMKPSYEVKPKFDITIKDKRINYDSKNDLSEVKLIVKVRNKNKLKKLNFKFKIDFFKNNQLIEIRNFNDDYYLNKGEQKEIVLNFSTKNDTDNVEYAIKGRVDTVKTTVVYVRFTSKKTNKEITKMVLSWVLVFFSLFAFFIVFIIDKNIDKESKSKLINFIFSILSIFTIILLVFSPVFIYLAIIYTL